MNNNDNRGLFGKYLVLKRDKNGKWIEKKTQCFVLSPDKKDAYGLASRQALLEYAKIIRKRNKILAVELEHWVELINRRNKEHEQYLT
jgi:hypothetical protein